MKCHYCNNAFDAGADWKFCPRCGAYISAKCRECGHKNPENANFCVMCGSAKSRQAISVKLTDAVSLLINARQAAGGSESKSDLFSLPEKNASDVSKRESLQETSETDALATLDLKSFNQAETPEFLKSINAKRAARFKTEEAARPVSNETSSGVLDSRSFNQADTPDFLSEIIMKGKTPGSVTSEPDASSSEENKPSLESVDANFFVEGEPVDGVFGEETAPVKAETPEIKREAVQAADQAPSSGRQELPDSFNEDKREEKKSASVESEKEELPSVSGSAEDGEADAQPKAALVRKPNFDKFKSSPRIGDIIKDVDIEPGAWNFQHKKHETELKTAGIKALEAEKNVQEPKPPVVEAVVDSHSRPKSQFEQQSKHPIEAEALSLKDYRLIAVDSGNNRIQFITSEGKFISSFGSRGALSAQFDNPQKAVVDMLGNIYVSDFSNNRIQKFTKDGHFILSFGAHGGKNGEFNYPCGLAVSREGLVFVVDSYNNRIQIFDCDAKYVSKFEGAEMSGDTRLDTPADVAIDNDNHIYVCDTGNNRVIKFDPKWRKLYELGIAERKQPGFDSPSGIAVDFEGNLIVADTGNHIIRIFDPNGGLISSFGSKGQKEGKLDSPGSVAVDGEKNIYIADTWNNRIQVFTYDGRLVKSIGSYGSDPGKFNHINAVVIAGEIL